MHRSLPVLFIALSTFVSASPDGKAPWESHAFDVESGMLWQVGNNTTIDYMIAQTQFSWRGPYVFRFDLDGGSTVVVRNHASLIAAWIVDGPEDYYLGIAGSPSLEWWAADNLWSAYVSIGGGLGVTNSTNVPDGQGQDFTFNWFAQAGVRYQIREDLALFGGPYFMHLSNGGQTDPNPAVDALGFTFGLSFTF